jgi:hypothetical protein
MFSVVCLSDPTYYAFPGTGPDPVPNKKKSWFCFHFIHGTGNKTKHWMIPTALTVTLSEYLNCHFGDWMLHNTVYPSKIYRRFGGTYGLLSSVISVQFWQSYTHCTLSLVRRDRLHIGVFIDTFFFSYFKMVSVTLRQFCVAACSNTRSLKGSESHTFYSHHYIFIYR